jgi:excisionase family DNA binding protein
MDARTTNTTAALTSLIAHEVAELLKPHIAAMTPNVIQPALLDVRDAAVYLGRSERAIEHLIQDRMLPIVRHGRRVHLHRRDLDDWIERNKE